MTKFKDIIFEENIAIHCPEEWMAEEVLEYAISKGYDWYIGGGYLNFNCWYIERQNTVYFLETGTYSSIDHARKSNYEILHYNDVVIKEGEEMETKLDYELWIKGRKAKIGSELWFDNGDGKLKEVTVSRISIFNFQDPQIRLKGKNNKHYFFWIDDLGFIDKCLFWEKPTLYQLPDTDGNLSEVKIGQHVWITYNDVYKRKGVIDKFNGSNIGIMLINNGKDNGKIFAKNKEGVTYYGGTVTTNKPIVYQLPDTEGNLSEVEIGQSVWMKYKGCGNICEHLISEFNGDDIKIKYINGNWSIYIKNKEGLTISGEQATTNKPSRFHGKQDWSQAPEKAMCWAIDDSGDAYWYTEKPITNQCFWDSNSFSNSSKDAGYRNDLINDRENMKVTDWKESLVMRPKNINP